MTRQEQIKKEAYTSYPLNPSARNPNKARPAFIKGAKWADDNPKEGLVELEKIKTWLLENLDNYLFGPGGIANQSLVDDLEKYLKE